VKNLISGSCPGKWIKPTKCRDGREDQPIDCDDLDVAGCDHFLYGPLIRSECPFSCGCRTA
jgi:hypothetical protein